MLNDAKERFIRAGGNLQHSRVRNILARAESEARTEAENLAAPPNPKAAKAIKDGIGALAVIFFSVVLVLGSGLVLVIIPVAEFASVLAGLEIITPLKPVITTSTGIAIFIGILVLKFLKHVYEDALPRGKPVSGLPLMVNRIEAWVGTKPAIDKEWTKVERDYTSLSAAQGLATLGIVLASFIGRLGTLLEAHGNKPLGESIQSIQSDLTGTQFIGVVVSTVIIVGLLRLLDATVLFSYTSFKNSAGSIDLADVKVIDFLEHYENLVEVKKAQALEDLTLQQENRNVQE